MNVEPKRERVSNMSDIYRPISDDPSAKTSAGYGATTPGTTYSATDYDTGSSNEAGKTLLAGMVGGIASAVGYIVYSRLPDEQRDKLHQQVRSLIESRINDLRSRFNL